MQMSLASRLEAVRKKLSEEYAIKFDNSWINDCFVFFIQQNPSINFEELCSSVKEQFLLANMTDSSISVIPNTFQFKKEAWTLNGRFILQMQFILEISEPFYEQWRRLHNIKLDDVQEVKESKTFHTKKKRCFKLQLTDGHKTIHAMEYKPISCLSTKLPPGIKVLITGPVQVVNKIVMIGPENIQIIGGEFDEILIINAYENVLLRMLKKPTTDKPIKDYNEESVSEKQCDRENKRNPVVKPQQQAANNDDILMEDDDDIDLDMLDAIEQQECFKNQQKQEDSNALFDDIDEDILAQIEQKEAEFCANNGITRDDSSITSTRVSRATDLLKPPPSTYQRNSEDSDNENIIMGSPEKTEKRKSSPTMNNAPVSKVARITPLKIPTFSDDDYPYKIENEYNFVTIDQYLFVKRLHKLRKTFAILGRIENIKKFTVDTNEWNFIVEVQDSFSENALTVRFADDVVTSFTRRTAAEMNLLREQIKTQPQLKEDIAEIIQRVNDSTQSKTFLMSISMKLVPPIDHVYIVTKIFKQTDDCKEVIQLKLNEEKILRKL